MLIQLASTRGSDLKGIILENTFKSLQAMIDDTRPFYHRFARLFLTLKMDSLSLIPVIEQPCLFLVGEKDDVVPNKHMDELYSNAQNSRFKRLDRFDNGAHVDMWMEMPY